MLLCTLPRRSRGQSLQYGLQILGKTARSTTVRALATTPPSKRSVRMENSKIDFDTKSYPTPGDGHQFRMNIFGLPFSIEDINDLQDAIWNDESFLPTRPAAHLPSDSVLNDLSNIGSKMAVTLEDGETSGLLASNECRSLTKSTLNNEHFVETMSLLKTFKNTKDPATKTELAHQISNVAFWAQWLIRGFLFEGKLHYELLCDPVIPSPLSKIAFAANAALGRHQIEFVYDDYTLKAANFSSDLDIDSIDYDDPKAILSAIASIRTPVGFNDMRGGLPEHNFRHNHSLMEYQMKRAFRGADLVLANADEASVLEGWDLIVEAARRSNLIFRTMLTNTPADSYPIIRLPIKGVRGACGSVYHQHGVFYEGCGQQTYDHKGEILEGCFVENEWGQTGANSSMYKFLDIFVGVANARSAYEPDPITLDKMQNVFSGKMDSGELGTNPIDSMQRAFDLFTRPVKHMKFLVKTAHRVKDSKILESTNYRVLLRRLRLAYWVAEHRITHGKYVLRAIYQTEPLGGQSRAAGTGGSTPPFLKIFLDQTLQPARDIIIQLLLDRDQLSADEIEETQKIARVLKDFEDKMTNIRNKGNVLEYEEKGKLGF